MTDLRKLGWLAPPVQVDAPMPITPKTPDAEVSVEKTAKLDASAAVQGTASQKPGQNGQEVPSAYTQRAAFNLENRLRKNPARLKELGEQMTKLVMSTDEKDKKLLRSLIVENHGDMAAVRMKVSQMVETDDLHLEMQSTIPMTALQVKEIYGQHADDVMRHKEAAGLVQTDKNLPGLTLYLIDQERVETGNEVHKRGVASLSLCQLCVNSLH